MPSLILGLVLLALSTFGGPDIESGYQFVDGHSHTTIKFEQYRDLIVIPVVMNDTVRLKLVLDTGTRSLLLYGKKFRRLSNLRRDKSVKVTGWGSPNGVDACLSYPNSISLGKVRGDALGVAIVDHGHMFDDIPSIDGIIGYELFVRFAVEINYKTSTIHLYDRLPENYAAQFTVFPLEVNMARPQVVSEITLANNKKIKLKLLIDTGSSLGLAVFSSTSEGFTTSEDLYPIGRGLNGNVYGYDLFVKEFLLGTLPVSKIPMHLVDVPLHPDDQFTFSGSLGAGFLRQHIVVFDYPRSTFLLSKPGS
jgi:hypothetical protein